MDGRRSRGHWVESPRDGGTRFTQLQNTCSRTGPTAACLELYGRFRVVTMSCGCASRAPRIRLIKAPGPRVSTESPTRNTSCLTTEYYIVVHVKDPPSINVVLDPDTLWASTDPAFFVGRLRSGSLLLGWTSSIMIYSNWATDGPHATSPPVGHPGLPDLGHVVDIPIKYTHNSMIYKMKYTLK